MKWLLNFWTQWFLNAIAPKLVSLAYAGELEFNNTKGILLSGTLSGDYGTNLVGDLLNLKPTQNAGVDGGVTDPTLSYYEILNLAPVKIGLFSENLGGSYVQITPNAVPSLANYGLRVFEPGGTEKATNAAYTAAELAGNFMLLLLIPVQQ